VEEVEVVAVEALGVVVGAGGDGSSREEYDSVRENHQSREELADIGVTTQSVREMIAGGGEHLRAVGVYRHLGGRDDGYLEDGQLRFIKEL
jgi:hypothetical protein